MFSRMIVFLALTASFLMALQASTNVHSSFDQNSKPKSENLLKLLGLKDRQKRDTAPSEKEHWNQAFGEVGAELKKELKTIRTELTAQMDALQKVIIRNSGIVTRTEDPKDCSDIFRTGRKNSGEYRIRTNGSEPFDVYCDMDKSGGGWTVIQRRGDFGNKADYFFETWDMYKKGFGNLSKEFWLGNDYISALTNQAPYDLQIDFWDYKFARKTYNYKRFKVDNEALGYKLTIAGSQEPGYNAMSFHNGMKFSTKDKDHDERPSTNCADFLKSAWWFKDCYRANLNGERERVQGSLRWHLTETEVIPVAFSEMKIRPSFF